MPDPLMRVSHLSSNLTALDALGDEIAARIRERCAAEIQTIETSIRTAWLPIELDVALTAAVEDIAGVEGARKWGRDAIAESGRGPLLGPILSALHRLGVSPHAALRRVPYGWTLIYRHCGDVRYEHVDEGAAAIVVEGVPEAMRELSYLRGIAAALDGVVELGGGEEIFTQLSVDGDVVRFDCRWSQR
ncbi:MAG: hypothetical protein KC619_15740 [Myxococcales bacterium]|nr:hypothetical protein [Myxococcales bacterium]